MQASSGHTCYTVSNWLFTLSEENKVLNKREHSEALHRKLDNSFYAA